MNLVLMFITVISMGLILGAVTQTSSNKSGLSLIAHAATGETTDVHMFKFGGIYIGYGTGDPNTEITAPIGSMYTDVSNGKVYKNTNAATAWSLLSMVNVATPVYAGEILSVDGKRYIAAYTTDGVAAGAVVMIAYGEVAGQEVLAATTATVAFPVMTAVAPAIVAVTTLAWFQIGGLCEASVEGTAAVAAGDFLEVLSTEADFKKDGTRSAESAAVAVDAQAAASAVIVTVFLIPEQHVITAT